MQIAQSNALRYHILLFQPAIPFLARHSELVSESPRFQEIAEQVCNDPYFFILSQTLPLSHLPSKNTIRLRDAKHLC